MEDSTAPSTGQSKNRALSAKSQRQGAHALLSLGCKDIQPVYPKGNQSWIFIGRTDAEVETPILWPPDAKSWLIWKDPNAGKDWGQEEKGMTRGWDGWMASLTQWTWVWVDSQRLWWIRRPGVLWFVGSQRAGHEIEQLNWPYCLRLRPPGYWLWWTSWHAIQHRWTCAAVWETMYCPRHHHRSKWTLDHPGKRRLESGDGGSNPPGDIFSICICTGPFQE